MYDMDYFEREFSPDHELNADKAIFGAVEVDHLGTIIAYNKREESLTGRKREDVVGKNFFEEIAPCTNTEIFRGKFTATVVSEKKPVIISYIFDYKMKPTKVQIFMKPATNKNSYWIVVQKLQKVR